MKHAFLTILCCWAMVLPGNANVEEGRLAACLSPTEKVTADLPAEVALTLCTDSFRLPALLTLPAVASQRQVPCVVLVHGSGPNDRDETIGPNKPFRDIAYGLAQRGIATLRYDKRTLVYKAACVPAGRELDYDTEVTDDALSAIELLAARPEIASDSIFLLGHSLGGTLAPRIAARTSRLSGVIIVAGLVRHMGDAVMDQVRYLSTLDTPNAESLKAQIPVLERLIANVKLLGSYGFDDTLPLPLGLPASYWKMVNDYRPAAVAATLSVPILVMQGERDYQVTTIDYALWQTSLAFYPMARFRLYPRLNHLLQEGEGKSVPSEYEVHAPVAAYVLDDMAAFVRGVLPARPAGR